MDLSLLADSLIKNGDAQNIAICVVNGRNVLKEVYSNPEQYAIAVIRDNQCLSM